MIYWLVWLVEPPGGGVESVQRGADGGQQLSTRLVQLLPLLHNISSEHLSFLPDNIREIPLVEKGK